MLNIGSFTIKLFEDIVFGDNFFKHQSHKMVKHTQTVRRQFADELFECVDHFVGLAHKEIIIENHKLKRWGLQ